ncbi:MAG: hypothetical protein J6575_03690 [Bifidobacterium sp.]|nr:hypothetical protein [Bifidobacterium sp.]
MRKGTGMAANDDKETQPTMRELVEVFRRLVDEATRAQLQIAVPITTVTRMLGMKDDAFTRRFCHQHGIRTRKMPGSKTTLVSVQSLREYMGDIPAKGR